MFKTRGTEAESEEVCEFSLQGGLLISSIFRKMRKILRNIFGGGEIIIRWQSILPSKFFLSGL